MLREEREVALFRFVFIFYNHIRVGKGEQLLPFFLGVIYLVVTLLAQRTGVEGARAIPTAYMM